MASTSKQTTGVVTLNYEQVKINYYNLLARNTELLKETRCTRKQIEEKIKLITDDPRESQQLSIKIVDGKNKLFVKKARGHWQRLEVISVEDAFPELLKAHIDCDHGDASVTYEKISKEYSLPFFTACWIVESCNVCNSKSDMQKPVETGSVGQTLNESGRGLWRLNIIQDKSLLINSGRVCFLLILKEDTTNFLVVRPLYESSEELALDLMKVFTEFGYPQKVFVPNMLTFYKKILHLVYLINPVAKVPVEEIHSDIFEKDQEEVLKEIENWTKMMQDTYWEQSCHIVQYKLNTTEKLFTRLFSTEEFVGIPFHQFFDYRFRSKMTWINPPYLEQKSVLELKTTSE